MAPTAPRYPVEPLLRKAGARDLHHLARLLDTTHANTLQYARRGLSWRQADTLACKLGYHPAHIWGDLWWATAPGPDELRTQQ